MIRKEFCSYEISKALYDLGYDYASLGSYTNARTFNLSEGAKDVLFSLGVGYYGANNTPEEILNLAWAADLCIYKAVYRYFEINKIPLPDFDFVYSYKEPKE